MAKGDDMRIKKKNKAIRKKLASDPSSVTSRVAGLIAAKKRRQSGKRRQCQGMCFSLPTPEDPFNERQGKDDISTSKIKALIPQSKNKNTANRQQKRMLGDDQVNMDNQETKKLKRTVDYLEKDKYTKLDAGDTQSLGYGVIPRDWKSCPSKFLCSCLNSMENSLFRDGVLDKDLDGPLFADSWGIEFWKSYFLGEDILENSGTSPSVQKMSWIASTAADSISQKESDGISVTSPFLLYLVSSQEKASKVRSVFKLLKAYGVHAVSLHPDTPVEHQVRGLKSCEPEFLVATPERLRELVSLKAVDISGVSMLVVDGMDSLSHCLDAVKRIKKSIKVNSFTLVFEGCSGGSYVEAVQSILRKPFQTLSSDAPRTSRAI